VQNKQGIVGYGDCGGVSLWSLLITAMVHLVFLGGLFFIRFTQATTAEQEKEITAVKLNRPDESDRDSVLLPKPKTKMVSFGKDKSAVVSAKSEAKIRSEITGGSYSQSSEQIQQEDIIYFPVDFEFGWEDERCRKICYVVDCSGSMRGMYGRVQEELKDLVEALEQDQFFYIIFFGADKLTEFGRGRFVRASKKTKNEAVVFIESIRPSGSTNALSAFERALQITDGSGAKPEVIYFLTDGFELAGVEKRGIVDSIIELLVEKGSQCRVNTIGFWPGDDDRKILQMIAQRSRGNAFFVYDATD
jgi:hypothetical protein